MPIVDNLRYADTYLVEAVNKSLSSYNIKEGTRFIGNYAFRNCSSLTSITIPNSVRSIGNYAFYECSSLTSITIPDSVTSIGNYAFQYCRNLEKVYNASNLDIQKGSTSNGYVAYYADVVYKGKRVQDGDFVYFINGGKKYVTEYLGSDNVIIIPQVDGIADYVFQYCSGLNSVTIPNSVTSIGDGAFWGCSGLNSVTIPNASIGNDAFSGCPIEVANVNAEAACSKDVLGTKLKKLVIGHDVRSIAGSAFSGCTSLKELSLGKNVKTIGQSAFSGCAALTNLTISENVETLGYNCFNGCSALKEVILGKSLRSIGNGAFGGADRIENIYSLNPVPPTCASESAFHEYTYKSAVVYVPNERNAIARYKADAVWSKFFEIYEKDMSNVGVVIPEYTITTSPEGYATFFSSEAAYALPNGLSAQVVTACSKNKLTYKTIADGSVSGIIPKGTAVMLVSEAKKAGTFKLTPAETATSYTGTNLLHGNDEATTATANGTNYYYKLTYGEGAESEIFGWYWGAADGAAFQIDGHKAWLALPKSSVTRSGFALDDETAIEEVITEEDAVYYDLQGRRIGTPTASGIYIVNGKKVMIKK